MWSLLASAMLSVSAYPIYGDGKLRFRSSQHRGSQLLEGLLGAGSVWLVGASRAFRWVFRRIFPSEARILYSTPSLSR